jgi:hypothetical protein
MLLGNATKAELRLIVWCRGVEPNPAQDGATARA